MRTLRMYKRSVKFLCSSCGNAQTAKTTSRCCREEKCSRCLQKLYELGKAAYWG